jgi:hypothetical protein
MPDRERGKPGRDKLAKEAPPFASPIDEPEVTKKACTCTRYDISKKLPYPARGVILNST